MNDIVTKEPPSIIQDMATRFGMDKRAFEATLKATVVPANVSNEQFAAFLLVAKQYNLNPITKEIYAFPAKSGGIQPIVGIDGWCNIINSHPQLDGIEFDDVKDANGTLTAIACKIFRKDRSHPITAIEYLSECKRGTEPWKQWPARMLRHKALIQAARYAFGFSGIVDPDEAERMVDVTPVVKSLFKNATLRKDWCNHIIAQLKECKSLAEIENVCEAVQPKINELHENGNEHDLLAIEAIMTNADICRKQFSNVAYENVVASYGQEFADTAHNDSLSLPTNEDMQLPSFIGKGAAA